MFFVVFLVVFDFCLGVWILMHLGFKGCFVFGFRGC